MSVRPAKPFRQATFDVQGARNARYPNLVIDAIYGTKLNAFALQRSSCRCPQFRPLPNPGYFITANLTIRSSTGEP
jgi:hypothetical protein